MATKKTTKVEEKKTLTVEIVTEDYPQIRTKILEGFTESDISAIERFLYEIDYIGAKNIRIVE